MVMDPLLQKLKQLENAIERNARRNSLLSHIELQHLNWFEPDYDELVMVVRDEKPTKRCSQFYILPDEPTKVANIISQSGLVVARGWMYASRNLYTDTSIDPQLGVAVTQWLEQMSLKKICQTRFYHVHSSFFEELNLEKLLDFQPLDEDYYVDFRFLLGVRPGVVIIDSPVSGTGISPIAADLIRSGYKGVLSLGGVTYSDPHLIIDQMSGLAIARFFEGEKSLDLDLKKVLDPLSLPSLYRYAFIDQKM